MSAPIKHGGWKHHRRTYRCWSDMKSRCNNPDNNDYRKYGARGIKVCQRWLEFPNFLADMGPKPDGLTLERIDNNGDYEPSNCRWATIEQQSNNTRRNHLITCFGRTQTIKQWAREVGVPPETIRWRIKAGHPPEACISKTALAPRET